MDQMELERFKQWCRSHLLERLLLKTIFELRTGVGGSTVAEVRDDLLRHIGQAPEELPAILGPMLKEPAMVALLVEEARGVSEELQGDVSRFASEISKDSQ